MQQHWLATHLKDTFLAVPFTCSPKCCPTSSRSKEERWASSRSMIAHFNLPTCRVWTINWPRRRVSPSEWGQYHSHPGLLAQHPLVTNSRNDDALPPRPFTTSATVCDWTVSSFKWVENYLDHYFWAMLVSVFHSLPYFSVSGPV